MTWPGWGNILPSVTLLATSAALLWAVVRLLVRPVAERCGQRSREAIRSVDAAGGGRTLRPAQGE